MKVLALYLPQYHCFKENDEWWGKGFTEWTNTKKAKPLYRNHYQPKEPLNDNYYDLSNVDVMINQAKLAKKYGVSGFVYYHYWFNGKKIMEKPLELMRKNKGVDMNYCLSWANEPWTRSWDGKAKEILIDQCYGDKSDWTKHYNYLSNFFSDDRYIKIDNKPVLFIYRINSIENHDEMISLWNKLAKKDGYRGIYLVETLTSFQKRPVSELSNAVFLFEPMYTTANEYNKISRAINCIKKIPFGISRGYRYIRTNDYNMISKKIVNRKENFSKSVWLGYFPGWDNTARRKTKASIIEGSTPEIFKKYLAKLKRKSLSLKSEYMIINAWNEWAEGAYLEPDKKYKFDYLNALKDVINDE